MSVSGNHSVSKIIQKTKAMVTKEIGYPIWQKDFYYVIADSEKRFSLCDRYIDDNPAAWLDKHAEPTGGLS